VFTLRDNLDPVEIGGNGCALELWLRRAAGGLAGTLALGRVRHGERMQGSSAGAPRAALSKQVKGPPFAAAPL